MTNKEAIKYLQQFYPHGGHSWLDAQRMKAIKMAIDALQEEPTGEKQVKESTKIQHDNKTCKENDDSLTQDPVSDDLEAAIDTYLATYFGGEKEKRDWPFLKKMAIHFANWQKKKDDYAIEIAHMAGEEEGKNIMKQKMMANAVDGAFIRRNRYTKKNVLNGFDTTCDAIQGFKDKDKIKVIFVKEG